MKNIPSVPVCLSAGISCTKNPDLDNVPLRDVSAITRTITPGTTPYNDKPILSTKTFKPIIILRTINPSPIFVYNPYMKPEYVSSYDLWMNRWDWAK